jgi:type IV pilus assembly protein PilB
MAPRRKLGELLLSEGLIDEVQLSSAIGHQRNWGGKLGSTLVELGFISDQDIARVLENQLKQHVLGDNDLIPEEGMVELLDGQEAHRLEVLPLRYEGSMLVLAMSNPYDLALIDELGYKLGRRIKGVLAVESSLRRAIKKYYFGEDGGKDYKIDMKKGGAATANMEVVHSDHRYTEDETEKPRTEDAGKPRQTGAPKKVEPSAELISKALAYLLIEKGIIKRDELIDKMRSLNDKTQG